MSPLLAFVLIFIATGLFYLWSSTLSFQRKTTPAGLEKAYTGGEELEKHRIQPDYSQFFPFAFFFTILHVVALMLATAVIESMGSFIIALIYILGALLGMGLLLRK